MNTALVAAITVVFLTGLYRALLHDNVTGKNTTGAAAHLPAAAALAICAFCTVDSIRNPARYTPAWFEDIALFSLITAAALATIFITRKYTTRKLLMGLAASAVSLSLALAALELLIRKTPLTALRTNRIGAGIHHIPNDSFSRKLFTPLPSEDTQSRMNREGTSFRTFINMRDSRPIPPPGPHPGEKRILWLGDSMVEAIQVPENKTFVALLENSTRMPHFNLATGGTSADFDFIILTRYFGMVDPDIVILGFYPENDFLEFGQAYAPCGFGPLFTMENSSFKYVCKKVTSAFSKAYTWPPNIILQAAADKTILGNLLLNIRNGFYDAAARKRSKPNPFPFAYTNGGAGISNASAVCAMLKQTADFTASHGAKFAIAMMPFPLDKGNTTEADALRRCSAGSGITLFDLNNLLPRRLLTMRGPDSIFLPDHHLNARGHAETAAALLPLEKDLLAQIH